jgi:hypothetical protein
MNKKYSSSLISRPGECDLLEYEFKFSDDRPVMGPCRAVHFAVRLVIRVQACQMTEDDVLEISHSPYINPITIIYQERESPRL